MPSPTLDELLLDLARDLRRAGLFDRRGLRRAKALAGRLRERIDPADEAAYRDQLADAGRRAAIEVELAAEDEERVWLGDPECDVCAGSGVYEDVITAWSARSGGLLGDVEVAESWTGGGPEITLTRGGERWLFRAKNRGDWLDLDVLDAVNAIAAGGAGAGVDGPQLLGVDAGGLVAVLTLDGDARRLLEARGWDFLEPGSCRVRREGDPPPDAAPPLGEVGSVRQPEGSPWAPPVDQEVLWRAAAERFRRAGRETIERILSIALRLPELTWMPDYLPAAAIPREEDASSVVAMLRREVEAREELAHLRPRPALRFLLGRLRRIGKLLDLNAPAPILASELGALGAGLRTIVDLEPAASWDEAERGEAPRLFEPWRPRTVVAGQHAFRLLAPWEEPVDSGAGDGATASLDLSSAYLDALGRPGWEGVWANQRAVLAEPRVPAVAVLAEVDLDGPASVAGAKAAAATDEARRSFRGWDGAREEPFLVGRLARLFGPLPEAPEAWCRLRATRRGSGQAVHDVRLVAGDDGVATLSVSAGEDAEAVAASAREMLFGAPELAAWTALVARSAGVVRVGVADGRLVYEPIEGDPPVWLLEG